MPRKKKRAARKAKTGGNPAMDFLVAFMKRRPKAAYADAAAAAKKARHKIYPVMWGRAQLLLGRVKAGQGRTKHAKAARRTTSRKAANRKVARKTTATRGRPRKVTRKARTRRSSGLTLSIADSQSPQELTAVVEAINQGAKAALIYRGDSWEIELT